MLSRSLATSPTRTFDRLDQMMEEMFGRSPSNTGTWLAPWYPAVDIQETEKEFHFVVELPGMRSENVNVELSNDILTISGKRETSTEEKQGCYIRQERSFGEFKRAFKLDAHVNPDAIQATFKDGILNVNVPKIEAVQPTKIQVKG